jgi:hypothetical protein
MAFGLSLGDPIPDGCQFPRPGIAIQSLWVAGLGRDWLELRRATLLKAGKGVKLSCPLKFTGDR